jgi:hypothetical protein
MSAPGPKKIKAGPSRNLLYSTKTSTVATATAAADSRRQKKESLATKPISPRTSRAVKIDRASMFAADLS